MYKLANLFLVSPHNLFVMYHTTHHTRHYSLAFTLRLTVGVWELKKIVWLSYAHNNVNFSYDMQYKITPRNSQIILVTDRVCTREVYVFKLLLEQLFLISFVILYKHNDFLS